MDKKRYITSAVYVAVLLGLIVLKWLVADFGALGFDALFCAISAIGCIEFFNAVKIVPEQQRIVTVAFCAAIVPLFVLCEMTGAGGYLPALILFTVYGLTTVGFALARLGGSNFTTTLLSFGAAGYLGILGCVFSAVNHLSVNSAPAVILMFLTVMLCDSFAYVFGKVLKRWLPFKLAPKVSPNKTVIGGVGGLVGGAVAGVVAYYLWFGLSKVAGQPLVYSGGMPAVVAFVIIGFVGALVGQLGDLFESFIKRRCDIKDSGKILPGHGGALDRFDSMLFVGPLVLAAFLLL